MGKISLIIPVYNKAPFLRRCFDSVVNQTEQDFQTIVIDDGSTDGSEKICDEYCKKYGWELYRTENKGVAEARNLGMSKAKNDYLAFLDGDDALVLEALDIMTRITRHEFNIIQFGQNRHKVGSYSYGTDPIRKGHYNLTKMPTRWPVVWNKIYKRSFVNKHKIKFPKGMQFGEDEIFNVKCILANGGLYHAPQTLFEHYFDDTESLCRGELCLERLEILISELDKLAKKQTEPAKREFINDKIVRHSNSKLFNRFGYNKHIKGSYDVVYFVKEAPTNEELRYSLRSVEANWPYNRVWFYGGCPDGLKPDEHVKCWQTATSKFERVRDMILEVCKNDNITESFWLFNDDFFVLKPRTEKSIPVMYNKTLEDRIFKIESRHGCMPTDYTKRLRHLVKTLQKDGLPTLDYAVHKPMLINRKKALEVLEKYPDEPMFRALYGNYWRLGGESNHDMKIQITNYSKVATALREWDFISTSDESFNHGNLGVYLRDKFATKSRFEV